MKKYLSFFRIRFVSGLQYRAAAWAGVATQFAWGFLYILLFCAFYQADPAAFPVPFSSLVSYVWLQQAFLTLFASWFVEFELFDAIISGNIAYELSRPLDLYNMWFTRSAALRLSRAALRCMPILFVAALLPEPFRLHPPAGGLQALLFLLSIVLGFILAVAYCMLIYIITFYTMSPMGVRMVASSLEELLSGSIIPLPFLPVPLRQALELLPFASMQNTPFWIYSGQIPQTQALAGILLQAVWAAAFLLLGRLLMKRALRRVVVQGG
jgi:ABC-2 type transport system permease protein